MARAIKKVKVKKVRGKKFYILLSIISLCVIGLGIGGYFLIKSLNDDNYEYFKDQQDAVISYSDLKDLVESDTVEELFVFVYDMTFDPEEDSNDKDIEAQVIEMYDISKDKSDLFEFYIVYTHGDDASILTDEVFGASEKSNSLIYLYAGSVTNYAEGDVDGNVYKDVIAGSDYTSIRAAKIYVKSYIS